MVGRRRSRGILLRGSLSELPGALVRDMVGPFSLEASCLPVQFPSFLFVTEGSVPLPLPPGKAWFCCQRGFDIFFEGPSGLFRRVSYRNSFNLPFAVKRGSAGKLLNIYNIYIYIYI